MMNDAKSLHKAIWACLGAALGLETDQAFSLSMQFFSAVLR